ncbi:MAG: chemotaxis protein methyltransferase CheR [Alphaproteobacteria bacterium]|jgi:chemotaxis protein methyltransferase CheR
MDCELSESSYLAFASFLHKKLGIVLGSTRQYLVRSRLSAIARNHHYTSLNVFLKDVINMKDHGLTDQCLELMTTNETFWFRDVYPFSLLITDILPNLNKNQKKLRIWSSACASGQEPYSIAMTIADYKRDNPHAFLGGVEILATDFSTKMIAASSAGIYDELALARGLDNHYRQRYFVPVEGKQHKNSMQLNGSIKGMVNFKRFNLLSDYSTLGKFDIIFCRNVLIYFDGNQKAEILKKFAACLPKSGALLLGAAESITGADTIFKMQSVSKGLYYSKL